MVRKRTEKVGLTSKKRSWREEKETETVPFNGYVTDITL